MNTSALLTVTALIEVGTGMALLVTPSGVFELLLGEGLSALPAVVLGRVAGTALIAIGVACWLGRNGGGKKALVAGLLIYNVGVPILLIHAALASRMSGIALWPASLLHVLLAIWCMACLRSHGYLDMVNRS